MGKQTIEELEAQVKQLAAENAALREYRPQPSGAEMMEALDAFYEREDVPEQGMMAAFEILCCKRPRAPVTDAYAAALRAEGVEMFANHQQMKYDNLVSSGKILTDTGFSHYLSGEASTFSAQLRSKSPEDTSDIEPFGFVRRSGDLVVIDVNGDPHIKDGMPVFVRSKSEVQS